MSRRRLPSPYPFEPLIAAMGVSIREFRDMFGLSGSTLQKFQLHGLTEDEADRFACGAGFHPQSIWPTWCEDGLTPLDDVFVNGNGWRQAWLWQESRMAS